MAKKRKAPRRQLEASNGPNMDVGESRKRIRDYEDVADSDDEFHINRDKVLLDEEPAAKRRRKWQEQEEFLEPSDEEVLDYSAAEDDEEDVDDGFTGEAMPYAQDGLASGSEDPDDRHAEDKDGIGWGLSKGEIYGADEIETEEQALEEEAEALRLQKKQLQSMTPADYGFDEAEWQNGDLKDDRDEKKREVVTEVLPQLVVNAETGPAERLKILKSRYPEFEPLSRELLSLKETHATLLKEVASEPHHHHDDLPNKTTKLTAASAYVGALAMYFALLCSPASSGKDDAVAMPAAQLRDHPVMESLVECRDLWMRAKDLPADIRPVVKDEVDSISARGTNDLLNASREQYDVQPPKIKKSRAQRHAEAEQALASARREERMRNTEADLANLNTLIAPSKSRKSQPTRTTDNEEGEEAPLTAHEAAEKAKRKKSLRFYTSQIAQKSNKRGTAGRKAGGDDDIPYRERLKDRQARLNAEAEKRGRRGAAADDLGGGESDDEDARLAQQIRSGGEADYYDLIASRTAQKKESAKAAAAQREAGGQVIQEESVGPDGKRKITYAIEKNKGLTPHRKKEVRNPRVKKRNKFAEKTKKLGSMRAVFKKGGGEGKGGYGGELTGIKRGVVRSVKL